MIHSLVLIHLGRTERIVDIDSFLHPAYLLFRWELAGTFHLDARTGIIKKVKTWKAKDVAEAKRIFGLMSNPRITVPQVKEYTVKPDDKAAIEGWKKKGLL